MKIAKKINYYKRKVFSNNYNACKRIILNDWTKFTGEPLFDIDNPKTYRQKIQSSKLYNNKIKTHLTDKVTVREWIKEKIGEEYLVPIIGIYESENDINFETLPSCFVIKMNHSSGMNIIVKNKEDIDYCLIREKIKKWKKINFAYKIGLQLQYKDIKPQIIIEEYIEDSNHELNDYKFICFNGTVYYCWVDVDRFGDHRRNIYDLNWKLQPFRQYYDNSDYEIDKPINFDKMINIANILCQGFDHVRVDLYNVDGKIYFSEMTFTNGNGYEEIIPNEYDLILGNLWNDKGVK